MSILGPNLHAEIQCFRAYVALTDSEIAARQALVAAIGDAAVQHYGPHAQVHICIMYMNIYIYICM